MSSVQLPTGKIPRMFQQEYIDAINAAFSEYLWHFYTSGEFHPGDALGGMMQYEADRKGIQFVGLIEELWAFKFPQYGFVLEEDGFTRLRK